ncbi:MAG: hypothetical protein LT070_10060 [Solirubrobacteraceae bacterium]|nr:hypothetical protein [Solirubrobacteraceae bacterium]
MRGARRRRRPRIPGIAGGYLRCVGVYRHYKRARRAAGLRDLRFHDLRHTVGTPMIGRASILQVKEWMGRADVDTTIKHLYYAPRTTDAALVAAAFAPEAPAVAPVAVAGS